MKLQKSLPLNKKLSKVLRLSLSPLKKLSKKGEEVRLTGFGSFKVNGRAARTGRNPRTGQEIKIAASKVPTFKPGKELKDAVNA